MIRRLLCQKCGTKPMHAADVRNGWKERRKVFNVAKPEGHCLIVNGVKQPEMKSLLCDSCGEATADGSEAVATTMWQSNREPEPPLWETGYLTLTPNAYEQPKS